MKKRRKQWYQHVEKMGAEKQPVQKPNKRKRTGEILVNGERRKKHD